MSNYCPWTRVDTLVVFLVANARPDTIFRIRPRVQAKSLFPNNATHKWEQTIPIVLDNNSSRTITASDFILSAQEDKFVLSLAKNGSPLSSVVLPPHSRYDTMLVKIDCGYGSHGGEALCHAKFTAHIKSLDSEFVETTFLDLTFIRPNFVDETRFTLNSITLNPKKGFADSVIDTMHLDPKTRSYSLSQLGPPVSMRSTVLNDSTVVLAIKGDGISGGRYREELNINILLRDFFMRDTIHKITIPIDDWTGDPADTVRYWKMLPPASRRASMISSTLNGLLYAATGTSLLKSIDQGETWEVIPIKDTSCNLFAVNSFGHIFRVGSDSHLHSSRDAGATWRLEYDGMSGLDPYYPYLEHPLRVSALAVIHDTLMLAQASGSSIIIPGFEHRWIDACYLSKDTGHTWSTFASDVFLRLAFDSSSNMIGLRRDAFYHLKHYGYWDIDNADASALGMLADGSYLVGTTSGRLYRSIGNDQVWTQLPMIFPDIRSIATTPSHEVYVSSWGNGIYYSPDDGRSWQQRNGGLTTHNISQIVATPGKPVYLATDDAWVWRSVDSISAIDGVANIADQEVLNLSVFPNPSQARMVIGYSLTKPSDVSIKLIDMLGRTVRSIPASSYKSGPAELTLSVSGLLPGVYIVCLSTPNGISAITRCAISGR